MELVFVIFLHSLFCCFEAFKTGNETTASACAKCRTMETFKKGLHGITKLHI